MSSCAIARFTSPISDAARFASRHRPYLVCSTKFSRASEMHNRMHKTIFASGQLTFYAFGCVLVNVYGKTFTVLPWMP